MTLASAAFGFGQPLRPNLMFIVGFFALGPVLWWIRTLHIQIRRSRDHFLHVGFLSPPVSAQCPTELSTCNTSYVVWDRLTYFRFTARELQQRKQVRPPQLSNRFRKPFPPCPTDL